MSDATKAHNIKRPVGVYRFLLLRFVCSSLVGFACGLVAFLWLFPPLLPPEPPGDWGELATNLANLDRLEKYAPLCMLSAAFVFVVFGELCAIISGARGFIATLRLHLYDVLAVGGLSLGLLIRAQAMNLRVAVGVCGFILLPAAAMWARRPGRAAVPGKES